MQRLISCTVLPRASVRSSITYTEPSSSSPAMSGSSFAVIFWATFWLVEKSSFPSPSNTRSALGCETCDPICWKSSVCIMVDPSSNISMYGEVRLSSSFASWFVTCSSPAIASM